MDVTQLESNLFDSFSRVKSDIIKLNDEINKVSLAVSKLATEQGELRENLAILFKKIGDVDASVRIMNAKPAKTVVIKEKAPKKKTVKKAAKKTVKKTTKKKAPAKKKAKVIYRTKPKRQHFVASKTGKKYHIEGSLMANKIKPKDRIVFKSKVAAENAGYQASKVVFKA